MALKIPKYLISVLFLASSLFVINCDSKIEEKPSDQSLANDTQNIPGLPPGIPSFPYIFNFLIVLFYYYERLILCS